MREVRTEIVIKAPRETVWEIITDINHYDLWNPFVVLGRGEIRLGEKITVRAEPKKGRGMTFFPVVNKLDPGREFSWLGHFLVPKLLDGEHGFVLEDAGAGKVRLIHSERFSGLLLPLAWKKLEETTRKGFELMNEAVKLRAEQRAGEKKPPKAKPKKKPQSKSKAGAKKKTPAKAKGK